MTLNLHYYEQPLSKYFYILIVELVYTSVVTKALYAEIEAKTEAVYLKTEPEAQGCWHILLTVLSQKEEG